jgi:hypothetical protein
MLGVVIQPPLPLGTAVLLPVMCPLGAVVVVFQPPIPLGAELLLPMMCPLGAVVVVSQPPLPSGIVVVVFWAKACPLIRSAASAMAIDLIICPSKLSPCTASAPHPVFRPRRGARRAVRALLWISSIWFAVHSRALIISAKILTFPDKPMPARRCFIEVSDLAGASVVGTEVWAWFDHPYAPHTE